LLGSVLHTSTPIAAALSKRRYQAVPLIFAALFVYWAVAAGSALDEAKWRGRRFLFNVTATRGGAWPPRLDGVQLLQDGCPVLPLPTAGGAAGDSGESWLGLGFDEDVLFNGFALADPPPGSDPARDPVKFALYVDTGAAAGNAGMLEVGGGAGWVLAGASGWRWSGTGGLQLLPELALTGPAPAVVDMRAPWWWLAAKLVPSVVSRPVPSVASRSRPPLGALIHGVSSSRPQLGRCRPSSCIATPRLPPVSACPACRLSPPVPDAAACSRTPRVTRRPVAAVYGAPRSRPPPALAVDWSPDRGLLARARACAHVCVHACVRACVCALISCGGGTLPGPRGRGPGGLSAGFILAGRGV
jgi:hypothetical protein